MEQKIQKDYELRQNYKTTRNYENLTKRIYDGNGTFNIPELMPTSYEPCEFIGFNKHKDCKERAEKGVHFFLDDYQFNRIWNQIDRYVPSLKQYKCVLSPDFSIYEDFPEALQIYNHYRKHWIGAYLQEHGIKVIPSIAWSGQYSYRWCFDGEPVGGAVAVSSVGTQRKKYTKETFLMGYQEMIRRLKPETILFYGKVPEECAGNIIRFAAFQEKFID